MLHYPDARRFAVPVLLPLAMMLAVPANAQGQTQASARVGAAVLKLDASTRARIEAIDGQFRPNIDPSTVFVSFRNIVSATVDVGDLQLGGEIIDARGYGEGHHSSVKTGDVNTLEPIQAYAAYRFHGIAGKGDSLVATAGRFTLNLGASRLVSRVDFSNTVPSYLGGKLEYRTRGKDGIVLFWTKPFTALPGDTDGIVENRVELDRAGGNMTFWGAHATVASPFGKVSVEPYFYRLTEEDRGGRATRNRHLNTFGARVRQAPAKGAFDFEVEAALQRGTARATTAASDLRDLSVRAGFVHAEAGWTKPGGWTPRFSAMFDYASGGSSSTSYSRFDSLFGARRTDYGPVSLFGPVGLANLVSPGVRVEAKPSKRFDLMGSVRELWLVDRTDTFAYTGVRDRAGASGRHGGVELEVRARRWLMPKKWKFELGAAYLAKGRFLKDAPNAPQTGDARYVYADTSWAF